MTEGASPRRAWLAAVASLVVPGLGQLVGRRFGRAYGLIALEMVVGLLVVATLFFVPLPTAAFWLPVIPYLLWRLWVARDAFRVNRERPDERGRVGWLRWTGAAAIFIALAIANRRSFDVLRWRVGFSAFRLPAESMAPALLAGDYLFTRPLGDQPLRRGEIVVFDWPEDVTRSFVKRVVGLPSDTLSMRDGLLEVNGRREQADYRLVRDSTPDNTGEEFSWHQRHLLPRARSASAYRPSRDTWGPLVVPERSYFVLGDNRNNSLDSRYWGFVRDEHLFARAWRIYFSRDPASGRVRWERMGRFIHHAAR